MAVYLVRGRVAGHLYQEVLEVDSFESLYDHPKLKGVTVHKVWRQVNKQWEEV